MSIDSKRVRDIFLTAAELPEGERTAYLAEACGSNAALRSEVEQLLAAHAEPASMLRSATGPHLGALPSTGPHVPQTEAGMTLINRYTLLEEIGEGGMGSVWMARQLEPVKRMVAIKLIKPGMNSKAVLARFEAERQALALMDHPNIARVLDGGETTDGRQFFVMDLVKGVPITQYCDAHRLGVRERLELFLPVCQAIQHAHQKGIIHRDIKPSNVLVALYDDRPVPKVIDFGVAKAIGQPLTELTYHTGFGTVIGTPQYMSPEQATFNNLDIDTRSDLYSLGVLLYELLVGSTPFTKKDLEKAGLMEMLRVVREVEPPRPSTKLSTADALPTLAANRNTEPKKLTGLLRNELDWVVMKALEKDRTRRYETAAAFAVDIQHYLTGGPVQAVPPSMSYRLRKFVRKHRGAVTASVVVLATLTAGIVGTTLGLIRAESALDVASQQQERAERESIHAKLESAHAVEEATKAKISEAAEKQAVQKAHRLLGLIHAAEGVKLADSGSLHLGLLKMTQSLAIAAESPQAVNMARTQFALYRKYSPSACGLETIIPQWRPVAVFSPDGRYILIGSFDGAVQIWDSKTRRSVAFAKKHAGPIFRVAFSPDGQLALTCSDDTTAQIWDARSGERVGDVLRHKHSVHRGAFSPDGRRVVTMPQWGGAQVWDAKTGRPIGEPMSHSGMQLTDVAFSPDGTRIVTASCDSTARVWDAASGKELLKLKHDDYVEVAVFSPDGRRIATGCKDRSVRVWDAGNGRQIGDLLRHNGSINSIAYASDGKLIMTASLDNCADLGCEQPSGGSSPATARGSSF